MRDIKVLDKVVTVKSTINDDTVSEMRELAKDLRAALGR